MSEVLEQANLQGVPLLQLDVDDYPDVAQKFGVRGLPTLILVEEEGEEREVDRKVGAAGAADVEEWLRSHTGSPATEDASLPGDL
jgi:thioredoxin-like negative regulator of GroEL